MLTLERPGIVHEHVDDSERAEQKGDDAVEREKGKVHAREVVRFDDGVLINQQENGEGDGDEIDGAQLRRDQAKRDQQCGGGKVGKA
jgi:hypothetical protein